MERLGGQVIEIAPDSPQPHFAHGRSDGHGRRDSPLVLESGFRLSLCELVVGGRDGLQPIEKTVIDRCVRLVYREMALGLETAENAAAPDFYEELLRQPEPEAERMRNGAGALLHRLSQPLQPSHQCQPQFPRGLLRAQRLWAKTSARSPCTSPTNLSRLRWEPNFKNGVATWCYIDEFHILLRDPLTASYFVTVWKMLRKQGCVPSALTQNRERPAGQPGDENILDNTGFHGPAVAGAE